MFHKIILFLGAAFFAAACLPAEEGAAGLPPAADRKVSYEADVKPLLERSCYRCHKGVKHKGDLRLDRKSAALRGGELVHQRIEIGFPVCRAGGHQGRDAAGKNRRGHLSLHS